MAKQKEDKEMTEVERNEAIRKAYRAGRKTIVLNGVEFNIERKDYNRKYDTTVFAEEGKGEKKHVSKKESWLHLTPTDPRRSLPVIQIELKYMGNLRSQF